MTVALVRDRFSTSLAWIASQIAARPKCVLAIWLASLVLVAWMF
jgi:hypothetical protein